LLPKKREFVRIGFEHKQVMLHTMGSETLKVLLAVLAGLTFGFYGPLSVVAQTVSGTDSLPQDYYDDGPHVFWADDSTAIVLYVCQGEFTADTFHVSGAFSFNGTCGDSETIYNVAAGRPDIQPHLCENVSRILAISDIHGEYGSFVSYLKNAGVINDALEWVWGDGHLVVLGDVFDRGPRHTECLWLIYELERQAAQTGGRVHLVLGNHELMVLRGDNRYVNQRYLDGIVKKTRIKHEDLYGPDTELGQWLRTKNAVVKINDVIFVHGGLSPDILKHGWTLAEINDFARSSLDLRSSQLAFDESAKLLFGSTGPFWYRGYHYGLENRYEQACSSDVDRILAHFGATTIVVGHTECPAIHTIWNPRVMAIDIPLDEIGSFEGVLWEKGIFRRVCGAGRLWPIE